MINSYCNSLDETFAQWVYFGIIKEEDAQCFSVQSSIEAGSYVLAVGAVILALINTLVNKAVVQYFRDLKPAVHVKGSQEDLEKSSSENSEGDEKIHPVPVLFTDTFRWLLRSEESESSAGEGSCVSVKSLTLNTSARSFAMDGSLHNAANDGSAIGTCSPALDIPETMDEIASDATSHVTSSEDDEQDVAVEMEDYYHERYSR